MTLLRGDSETQEILETLDGETQLAIEVAVNTVRGTFLSRGFKALNDDRLATVEACIIRYFLESQAGG